MYPETLGEWCPPSGQSFVSTVFIIHQRALPSYLAGTWRINMKDIKLSMYINNQDFPGEFKSQAADLNCFNVLHLERLDGRWWREKVPPMELLVQVTQCDKVAYAVASCQQYCWVYWPVPAEPPCSLLGPLIWNGPMRREDETPRTNQIPPESASKVKNAHVWVYPDTPVRLLCEPHEWWTYTYMYTNSSGREPRRASKFLVVWFPCSF